MSQGEEKKNESIKILSNKVKENLFNKMGEICSFSENYLGKPIKPSELRIIIDHNYVFQRKINDFQFEILNYSFDYERDLNKNEKILKSINENFSIFNEYNKYDKYKIKSINLFPQFRKGLIFKPQYFDFFIFENDKKIKYEFKERKKNDFFIYSKNCNINLLSLIKSYIDYLDEIFIYMEKIDTIYLILYLKNITDYENYLKLIQSKLNYPPEKLQIVFCSNDLNENKPINIFNFFPKNTELYFFIVNTSNKVLCVKTFSNFEKKIKKYFEDSKDLKTKNKYIDIIYNLNKITKQYYIHSFSLSYKIRIRIDDDFKKIIPEKLLNVKINGEFKSNQYSYLKQIQSISKIQIQITEIETFSINLNFNELKCSHCRKTIPEKEGIYYCYWCKIPFCENCFEITLTLNNYNNNISHFKDRLIHKEHNLLYFKTRNLLNLQDLDKYKLGNNKFKEPNVSISYHHSAICNGCNTGNFETNDKKIRYICVSCRPGKKISGGYVDYCYNCFNDMRLNNDIGINIQNTVDFNVMNFNPNIPNKHNHNNHVYFVLTCEVNRQYDIY